MTQKEHVAFIRGLLSLKPELAQLSHHKLFAVIEACTKVVHGVCATREHLFLALKGFKKNAPKRRWDLKQRWLVASLLLQPHLSSSTLIQQARSIFNERTRPSVIDSAREQASKLRGTPEAELLISAVIEAIAAKTGESILA